MTRLLAAPLSLLTALALLVPASGLAKDKKKDPEEIGNRQVDGIAPNDVFHVVRHNTPARRTEEDHVSATKAGYCRSVRQLETLARQVFRERCVDRGIRALSVGSRVLTVRT